MNAKPQVAAPTAVGGASGAPDAAVEAAAVEAAAVQAAVTADVRPLRRDAERNRRLILGAAKALFALRGLDVSLDEVAKEAGLGVGTVYRRFPNREALIDALFDDMVGSIKRIADESLAVPRAWDGLVSFMTAMLETQAHDKGLRDAMIAWQDGLDERGRQKRQALRETVQPMLEVLVVRARQEGDLRADVVPSDIGVLLVMAVSMLELTAPVAPDNWRRHLSVIVDGLRARPGGANSPLTEPPLDDEQMEACMAGWKYGTRETPRHRVKHS